MVFAGMGTIAIVFPEKAALAYRGESCWWGSGAGFMGGWGMGWFGPLFMMLFWGFLIAGAIFLDRNVAVIAFTRRRIDLGQICSI